MSFPRFLRRVLDINTYMGKSESNMNSKTTVGYQQVTSEIQLELEELREAIREINVTLTHILRVLEQKTEGYEF